MGTKTISLQDDAYEMLKKEKKEGESFSDVVRRLTSNIKLEEYHGVISDKTGDEIEENIEKIRNKNIELKEKRKKELIDEFNQE